MADHKIDNSGPAPTCSTRSHLADAFNRLALSEVIKLEHLANLDLSFLAGHGIGTAFDPFDYLLQRLALPEPEAGDQLLGLGEWPVNHVRLSPENLTRPFRTCLQTFRDEHHPSFDEFLVEFSGVDRM